jgi:hypothetical protein
VGEEAIGILKQLLRMVIFLELAALQNENFVRIDDGVEPMSNCDDCAASKGVVHCLVNDAFCSDVNVSSGFINQHDSRGFEDGTSNTDELPFAYTQILSVFGDLHKSIWILL